MLYFLKAYYLFLAMLGLCCTFALCMSVCLRKGYIPYEEILLKINIWYVHGLRKGDCHVLRSALQLEVGGERVREKLISTKRKG